ncbi:MAG: undecaprenyldiphospho-muramoylpentapeptide beta-N-acetylglucosaminyltransferase [Pseudomonadota bacterium]|nr:undecaprenyldiphospho-muramoylpentapeptide beta-N-acetylglucosaminyltransferase [Pseudomonadota bacterium]
MNPRTALMMAGGTGGHIFPALAVAGQLRSRGWQVVWLGTRNGLEGRLVPPHGFEIEWLSVAGLRGKGWLGLVAGIPRAVLALYQALRTMLCRRPDVVVGFGGFVSFPGGLAAALTRRPLLVHEQNSVAGLSNRILALLARDVVAGFPDPFRQRGGNPLARILPRPARCHWSGNPVRSELSAVAAPGERFAGRSGPLRLLVVGGSQGARALNSVVPAALALLPAAARPLVLHQAGPRLLDEMHDAYSSLGLQAEVRPFIDDMAQALAQADLVICRAGALTVAELCAVGVAALLVPFPFAVDDHQTGNGRFLVEAGAAELLPQSSLDAPLLAARIAALDRPRLLAMATAARALARPHAAAEVADRVEACADRRNPVGEMR